AAPQSAVSADQAASATLMMLTRLARSARRAIGMPASAYSTANAVPASSPSWVSLRRSSAFIGWAMTGMRLRSAELKAYASISSSVTSRRYAAASRVAATPASAATLALAQRLRLLGPVGLDVERSRPLVQLLVLADLRL